MTIFDLLFLMLALSFVVATAIALFTAARRQYTRAWRIGRMVLISAGLYLAIVIGVSLFFPRRKFKVGEARCFDDWCLAVESFTRHEAPPGVDYTVVLRLSSRARRVAQRENNLAVYLTDRADHRYDPIPDGSEGSLNILLQPGESVLVSRRFLVRQGKQNVGLVATHEGGFPIEWLIIGYDTWFRRPAIVPLD